MLHLDEGILSALLDGELSGAEQQEVETHLRGCAECRDRLAELKGFMQVADQLVTALDELPARAVPSPLVRRRDYRALAWAASIVLAIGLGVAGRSVFLDRSATNSPTASGRINRQSGAVVDAPMPTAAATPPAAEPVASSSGKARPEPTDRQVAQDAERRAEADSVTPVLTGADSLGIRSQVVGTLAEAPRREENDAAAGAGAPAPADLGLQDSTAQSNQLSAAAEKVMDGLRAPAAGEIQAPVPPAALMQPRNEAGYARLNRIGARTITMEEAVRVLGGSIRLVDSLVPVRLEMTPADSTIRVIYQPAGVEIWLDQRRNRGAAEESRAAGAARERKLATGSNQLSWNDLQGFYLTLTAPLPSAALAQIKARIR